MSEERRRKIRQFLDTLDKDDDKLVLAEMYGENDPITLFFKFLAGLDQNDKQRLHAIGMGAYDKYLVNVDVPGPDHVVKPAMRPVVDQVLTNAINDVCNRG